MPNWRTSYLAAVLESDPVKLERLIKETEEAMFLRLQELSQSSDGHLERHEITVAQANLLTLITEMKSWPDYRQS